MVPRRRRHRRNHNRIAQIRRQSSSFAHDTARRRVDPRYAECNKALDFIAGKQDTTGAWWGRWGCNYLYGTSAVLCGLEYFAPERDDIRDMTRSAIAWIKSCQNPDGGWGEDLASYKDRRLAGTGAPTPSQTA